MKSESFRTAQKGATWALPGLAVGALVLGVAFSASARDVTTPRRVSGRADFQGAHGSAAAAGRRRWYQVGVASWYGREFQGRKTAAGERFDMNDMTCAHPTLPMGTWLKVTNLRNRQTAFVRVNDRGPVFDGRIVDLSFAAARAVGLKGVGRVRLEAVPASDPAVIEGLLAQVQMPVLSQPLYR